MTTPNYIITIILFTIFVIFCAFMFKKLEHKKDSVLLYTPSKLFYIYGAIFIFIILILTVFMFLTSGKLPYMVTTVILAIITASVTVVILLFLFVLKKQKSIIQNSTAPNKKNPLFILTITGVFITGFIIRILMSINITGNLYDLSLFKWWGDDMAKEPFEIYHNIPSVDNTPGALYSLMLQGFMLKILGMQHLDTNSPVIWLFFSILPIIFEMLTAWVIFRFALKYSNKWMALLYASLYIFNTAILATTVGWGGREAILTFFLVLCAIKLYDKKYISAAIFYGVSITLKIHCMVLAPVIFIYMLQRFIKIKQDRPKIIYSIIAFIDIFLLLCVPYFTHAINIFGFILLAFIFGIQIITALLGKYTKIFQSHKLFANIGLLFLIGLGLILGLVIGNYKSLLSPYIFQLGNWNYYVIHAFNLYGALGLNYVTPKAPIGTVITALTILTISAISIFLYSWGVYKKKENEVFFLLCAFLFISVFMFVPKTHERYIYPFFALLLLAFIVNRDKRLLLIYFGFSLLGFINILGKLAIMHLGQPDWYVKTNAPYMIYSWISVCFYIYSFIVTITICAGLKSPLLKVYNKIKNLAKH